MKETLKAWAAGIMDGEGSVMISKAADSYCVLVCAANNNRDMMDVLRNNWANKGDGRKLGGMSYAKTHIREFKSRDSRNTSYKIVFNLQDSKKLLTDISQYLVAKRLNALVILDAISRIEEREFSPHGVPHLTISDVLRPIYNEYCYLWSKKGCGLPHKPPDTAFQRLREQLRTRRNTIES